MMSNEIVILSVSAATVGFLHTLTGPDHYLPFIVMSKARNWSLLKTSILTLICGIGHVGSSILLGILGIVFGIGVSKLESAESVRGNIAAWSFVIFGLVYLLWGLWQARKKKPHTHFHAHGEIIHEHEHHHHADNHTLIHSHPHKKEKKNITPWILFTIFVLGPCEPLIPFFIYPAAQHSKTGIIFVSVVFSVITLLTMLTMVLIFSTGLKSLPFGKLERHTHTIAGATIFLSGCGIVFLGL